MNTRHHVGAAVTAFELLAMSDCAVTRRQGSVGASVDDAAITTVVAWKVGGVKADRNDIAIRP